MNNTLAVLLLAAGLVVGQPAQALVISVNPSAQTVTAGASMSVDINIDGLGDGVTPSLGTFDIDLGFDAALLSVTNVQFGTQLDVLGLGSIQSATSSDGSVNLFELSLDLASDLDALQAPNFTLATITFDTRLAGTSALTLSVNALGDASGDPLQATIANGAATIQSSVIPEPSSALLLSIGFATLGATAARRRQIAIQ